MNTYIVESVWIFGLLVFVVNADSHEEAERLATEYRGDDLNLDRPLAVERVVEVATNIEGVVHVAT